ncbi:Nuclear pore complex protein NUP85, partial [Mucuna pruriens]
MPSDTVGNGALVSFAGDSPAVYPLHHGLAPPICRLSISWSRGNSFRLSLFAGAGAAKVVEVKLSSEDSEIPDAQWRQIAYGSVAPFAFLQSQRSSLLALSKTPSPYHSDWWEHVLQYSKEIGSLLGGPKLPSSPIIEDPNAIVKIGEEPTCLKAAWELIEIFYVDKQSQAWLPERLVDWLADYDSLFTSTHETIHGNLVDFQKDLVNIQVIEDDPKYWDLLSSALSIGWLDIVVKMLRLHGSYQLDQLSNRESLSVLRLVLWSTEVQNLLLFNSIMASGSLPSNDQRKKKKTTAIAAVLLLLLLVAMVHLYNQ